MSFGRSSRSRATLPVWYERALIGTVLVMALVFGSSVGVLISCVFHGWCPR